LTSDLIHSGSSWIQFDLIGAKPASGQLVPRRPLDARLGLGPRLRSRPCGARSEPRAKTRRTVSSRVRFWCHEMDKDSYGFRDRAGAKPCDDGFHQGPRQEWPGAWRIPASLLPLAGL